MTFLPIQFYTKLKVDETNGINPSEVLDLIQSYLKKKRFNYIERKETKIVFHAADTWTSFDLKSFLVSGIVEVKKKEGFLIITNGNWMVFLIAVPFIPILLFADSDFSTLDDSEVKMIWWAFYWLFGGNLFARIIAHLSFKSTLKKLINKQLK